MKDSKPDWDKPDAAIPLVDFQEQKRKFKESCNDPLPDTLCRRCGAFYFEEHGHECGPPKTFYAASHQLNEALKDLWSAIYDSFSLPDFIRGIIIGWLFAFVVYAIYLLLK